MLDNDKHARLMEIGKSTYADVCAMVDALNVDYDLLDELLTARKPWTVGKNMPGYMPDTDPTTYATWRDARDALIWELESEAEASPDDATAEPYIDGAREIEKLDIENELGVTIGNYHWFITKSHQDGLNDDEWEELHNMQAAANGCTSYDEAANIMLEDALCVETRQDWHAIGTRLDDIPREYRILLGTGGPAMQIVGDLNEHNEPTTARLEVQDWFTAWVTYPQADEDILLQYAQRFYFGE